MNDYPKALYCPKADPAARFSEWADIVRTINQNGFHQRNAVNESEELKLRATGYVEAGELLEVPQPAVTTSATQESSRVMGQEYPKVVYRSDKRYVDDYKQLCIDISAKRVECVSVENEIEEDEAREDGFVDLGTLMEPFPAPDPAVILAEPAPAPARRGATARAA